MEPLIDIKNLSKQYKSSNVKAIDDISFEIRKGELFAFLGVNGAGKSTTINILVGIIKKDNGEIYIEGKNIEEQSSLLKNDIGVVFQSSLLDKHLTVRQNLFFRAVLYGINKKEFEERLSFFSEQLELKPILNRPLGKLSGGQKRKVDIVRALIYKPKILILDEPTTGLDPKTRQEVWLLINNLIKKDNLTVLLTTHYMEEAVNSNYVVIIDKGKIVCRGTPQELKNKYANDYLNIYKYKDELLDVLKEENVKYKKDNNKIQILFDSTTSAKDFVISYQKYIYDLEIIKGTMDDVFLNVTGKELI